VDPQGLPLRSIEPLGLPHAPPEWTIEANGPKLPRTLPALAHEAWPPRTGLTQQSSGSRSDQVRAPSFSLAVPPTCHKQRSPAVPSGHSRPLEEDRWPGRQLPDLGWGRRPKLHGMRSLRQAVAAHGNSFGLSCCSRADPICDRLPPMATRGLHKGTSLVSSRGNTLRAAWTLGSLTR
jgi:hypothetical protein